MRRKAIKIAAAALALVMALSLAGCQGTDPGEREEGEYQVIELTMAVNGTDTRSTRASATTSPSSSRSAPAAT